MAKAKPNNTETTARTTDDMRGSSTEAEPVYNASVGEPLLAEVEVLFFTEGDGAIGIGLLWDMTAVGMMGLDELPTEEGTDIADGIEELSGCTAEELAASGDAVAFASGSWDSDEDEATGTTDKPRVLVKIFPPAVEVRVAVTVKTEAELESRAIFKLCDEPLDDTARAFSRLD
jgi:hypothetical protein